MESPINLTSFPSILLILALFRIGITVSTSRLILLQADAGQTVLTFGDFVAGGNLIVGIIIFMIVTIINFIVITKGAERVAEVSARFSLDAMPGKQMSIDNDLRAGNITAEEATTRRNDLDLLSKLYGAMDGAMKFVKGDAIASILDILVNLIGGILIGTMSHDLDVGTAAKTYSILTIGDGLVQQIPAILVSLTAGMMITKVGNYEDGGHLGEEILNQIFADYRSVMVTSLFLFLLMLVPGLPVLELSGLGILFIVITVFLYRKKHNEIDGNSQGVRFIDDSKPSGKTTGDTLLATPIMILTSSKLEENIQKILLQAIRQLKKHVKDDIGISFPEISVKSDSSLAKGTISLCIYEIPAGQINLEHVNSLLALTNSTILEELGITDFTENHIYVGGKYKGYWVSSQYREQLTNAQINFYDFAKFLECALIEVIYENINYIFSMNEVRILISDIKEFRDLVNELLRMLPLNTLTEIFQRLVQENISLRNFKIILSTLLEIAQTEKDPIIITEYIRKALNRYIVHKFTQNGVVHGILLENDLQEVLREGVIFTNNTTRLEISHELKEQILYQIEEIIRNNNTVDNLSIITTFDLRAYVKQLIRKSLPFIQVLSYQELGEDITVENYGVILLEI
jgi:type III secretion protein V